MLKKLSSVKRKIAIISDVVHYMGLKWLLIKLSHIGLKRIGYFYLIDARILHKQKKSLNYLKIPIPQLISNSYCPESTSTKRADNALVGDLFFFSHHPLSIKNDTGFNWHINPMNHHQAPANQPWRNLPDFGPWGDIKCIWEASRFSQVFYFIDAFQLTHDSKYANGCIDMIIDWIEQNPYPNGVHYKCGQEVAFRTLAFILAIDVFREYLTDTKKVQILKMIRISLLRVSSSIAFVAATIRNNHSISEAAILYIGGLLFPDFPESRQLQKKGLRYLLSETTYQIYDDGAYIQHSMNYHRLAMDMLSVVIQTSNTMKHKLPDILRQRHSKLLTFLYSFVQENGQVPNYGNNDGAYLLPLDDYDYRNMKPSLNFANYVQSQQLLFANHTAIVRLFNSETPKTTHPIKTRQTFPVGGYYILKNERCFVMVRAHTYFDRPHQNDMLHVDIWVDGKNIFSDSGTYSYNTNKEVAKSFYGVEGHNTLSLNHIEPMEKKSAFFLNNWSEATVTQLSKNAITLCHYGYQKHVGSIHTRKITLQDNKIEISDSITTPSTPCILTQTWNTPCPITKQNNRMLMDKKYEIHSSATLKPSTEYRYSEFYFHFERGKKIQFETSSSEYLNITTYVTLNH